MPSGLLLLLLVAGPLVAQAGPVPVAVQVPLFLKILSFDRHLAARPEGPVVVGVLFQGKYAVSARVAEQVREAADRSRAEDPGAMRLRLVLIDLDEEPDLAEVLVRHAIRLLYVSPLRAVDLRKVSAVSRLAGITTLTGVPRYVSAGLAIGVDLQGNRPEIMINLVAARAEGADLDARLLKLARIVE